MYRQKILELLETCRAAEHQGFNREAIRFKFLPELIKPWLTSPADFLAWVREDREYAYFYFEVQESGACAKPKEAAIMILDAIIEDLMENS